MRKKTIRLARSPDTDDAFMFYALATRKIDTENLLYEHTLLDIETLNGKAMNGGGEYDVSAISFHAFAYLAEGYALLGCGGNVGRNYGPIVVSRKSIGKDELLDKKVAIPGAMTTACLALRLFAPEIGHEVVPFDHILEDMEKGVFDVGLIIHEGQLTYRDHGFHKVLDLGEWWYETTGMPLPLGCNVIRRDLGIPLMKQISRHVKESIQYALDHRDEAMKYAISFSRGLDEHRADRFVRMYVNDLTLEYGESGRQGIRKLLDEALMKGLIPKAPPIEFVS